MLSTLSNEQLDEQYLQTRMDMAGIAHDLGDAAHVREKLNAYLVASTLPSLSTSTYQHLQECFPVFLTPERGALLKANFKILGLFKPRNYDQTLSMLKVQFRAYLDEVNHFASEDARVGELNMRFIELRRYLDDIARETTARGLRLPHLRKPTKAASDTAYASNDFAAKSDSLDTLANIEHNLAQQSLTRSRSMAHDYVHKDITTNQTAATDSQPGTMEDNRGSRHSCSAPTHSAPSDYSAPSDPSSPSDCSSSCDCSSGSAD